MSIKSKKARLGAYAVAAIMLSLTGAISLNSSSATAGVITTFNNLTAFNLAVGGSQTVEDFTSTFHFPISTGILNSATNEPGASNGGIAPGDIQPGVTYSTPVKTGLFFNIDAVAEYGAGGFLDTITGPAVLTVTFDNPTTAFGFDKVSLVSLAGGSFDVTIKFLAGLDLVFSNATPASLSFFGWQSSLADITSVEISNTTNNSTFGFDLDNFRFSATSTPVPEPGTLALFGLGLLGLGLARRKKAA